MNPIRTRRNLTLRIRRNITLRQRIRQNTNVRSTLISSNRHARNMISNMITILNRHRTTYHRLRQTTQRIMNARLSSVTTQTNVLTHRRRLILLNCLLNGNLNKIMRLLGRVLIHRNVITCNLSRINARKLCRKRSSTTHEKLRNMTLRMIMRTIKINVLLNVRTIRIRRLGRNLTLRVNLKRMNRINTNTITLMLSSRLRILKTSTINARMMSILRRRIPHNIQKQ